MSESGILVAGIGNIFLGDDAFGVEVIRRLGSRPWPPGVHVRDFGIRGIDLVYAMMDGYSMVILVDAVQRGHPPGTLYVIEPEIPDAAGDSGSPMPLMEMHELDPAKVLRLARSMGISLNRVLLVGCEPLRLGDAEGCPEGLSAPVSAAIDGAVELVESLVDRARHGETADHLAPSGSAGSFTVIHSSTV